MPCRRNVLAVRRSENGNGVKHQISGVSQLTMAGRPAASLRLFCCRRIGGLLWRNGWRRRPSAIMAACYLVALAREAIGGWRHLNSQ